MSQISENKEAAAPPVGATPPVRDESPEMHTLSEVAQLLRVNVETVRRLAERGEIAGALKIGGQWRFNRARLQEMIGGR